VNRRNFLESSILAACTVPAVISGASTPVRDSLWSTSFKHSVSRWCFSKIPLEEFCVQVKALGIASIELLDPEEWSIVQKHGLTCAMSNGASLHIPYGFNNPKYHDQLKSEYIRLIQLAQESGIENIVCFSGNRYGLPDDQCIDIAARGLESLVKIAEKAGVNLVMELLNSKIDHGEYMCDHTSWGVKLVDKVNSPNFGLLYDIYHMQIMEGDVIRTIQKFHPYFKHYHTAGVPGRHEIDDSQELYYPAIMQAIANTGYTGFVGQEFIPVSKDPIQSLAQAINICTPKNHR